MEEKPNYNHITYSNESDLIKPDSEEQTIKLFNINKATTLNLDESIEDRAKELFLKELGNKIQFESWIINFATKFATEQAALDAVKHKEEITKLIIALNDIKNWDDALEDKWEDPGYRAETALEEYHKRTSPTI